MIRFKCVVGRETASWSCTPREPSSVLSGSPFGPAAKQRSLLGSRSYICVHRACLEYLRVSGQQPDIIHAHEWQLSAVPMLYWQAECHTPLLSGDAFATMDRALDERTIGHNPERLSLMKGGIVEALFDECLS